MGKVCERDGCVKRARVKGFCEAHYVEYLAELEADGFTVPKCSTDGCDGYAVCGDKCRNCYARKYRKRVNPGCRASRRVRKNVVGRMCYSKRHFLGSEDDLKEVVTTGGRVIHSCRRCLAEAEEAARRKHRSALLLEKEKAIQICGREEYLFALLSREHRPKCASTFEETVSEGFVSPWTDYDEDTTPTSSVALKLCEGCPLARLCYGVANSRGETHGVWGGVVFSEGGPLARFDKKVFAGVDEVATDI